MKSIALRVMLGVLGASVALATVVGCQNSAASKPSQKDVAAFRGTPPTPEELARRREAQERIMARANQPSSYKPTPEQEAQMQKMREEFAKRGTAPKP